MTKQRTGKTRLVITSLAAAAMLAIGGAAAGSAQAATITIAPTGTASSSTFPFGIDNWTPHAGYAYRNLPAFNLKAGDTIAFDNELPNDVPVGMEIAMAPSTINGGDQPASTFTKIVAQSSPANPLGNNVNDDYEMAFNVTTPFNFAGGGLIIKFSNPTAQFITDSTVTSTFQSSTADRFDPSGFFWSRFIQDADGNFPWTVTDDDFIIPFRLNIADPVPAKKKKCKKKKKGKKKKCKKKKKK